MDMGSNVMISGGRVEVGDVEEGIERINGDEQRHDLWW